MAKELRHEVLRGLIADGTVTSNAAAQFRNDSAGMLHIRGIDYTHLLATAEADEQAIAEISKAPVLQSGTNNSPFFAWPQRVASAGSTTGAAVDDASWAENGAKRWGRGQLTLEPNETLFVNVFKSTGGNFTFIYVIEYEFA